MNCLVLVASNPCETAAGALYQALFPNATVRVMSVSSIRHLTEEQIRILPSAKSILMIGTYWQDKLPMFVQIWPLMPITILCPGIVPNLNFPNVLFVSDPEPCHFAINVALLEMESKTCAQLMNKMLEKEITMIDDRFNYRNVEQNQAFFTGMFNLESKNDELTLFDRFYGLFCGKYDQTDIIAGGQAILNSQLMLAKERVINNSKQIQLQDGTKAVLTEASELVNLTHDALHRKFPDAAVTLVVGLKFGEKDEMSYSIRSFDSDVNAQTLAHKIGGDGTATTAGGRVAIDIPYPL